MMVGTHNTIDVVVECQVHMGGWVGFFRKDGRRYLQNTIGVWGALPRVLGVVNPGAPHRCPEARGGPFFAVWEPQRRLQYYRDKHRRLQYYRHKCRYLPLQEIRLNQG